MTDSANLRPVNWDAFSELHVKGDGGGLFSSMKAIRQGKLVDLVRFVASLPEQEREHYVIEKGGDHSFDANEIMMLSRRSDFPVA